MLYVVSRPSVLLFSGVLALAACSGEGPASPGSGGGPAPGGGRSGSGGDASGGGGDGSSRGGQGGRSSGGTGGDGVTGGSQGGGSGGSTPGGAGGASARGGASGGVTASGGGTSTSSGGRGGSAPGSGGAPQAGGATGGGGARDAGPDGPVNPPPAAFGARAYNGRRGEAWNTGWRFNRGDVSGAEKPSFGDSAWKSLELPHDWSIELAFSSSSPSGSSGGYLDGGIGWYRKSFTLAPGAAGERIFLAFDGVYMNSQVWVNGTSMGTRPYGYSTFEYDITEQVKTDGSANVVAVRVNNNQPNSRWYSGSGIYRNVWLTRLGAVHIPQSGVFVTTPTVSEAAATVSVSTEVKNTTAGSNAVTVRSTITDADGSTVATGESPASNVASGSSTTVNQSLEVPSPRLWSTTSPYLYLVKVELEVGGAIVDTYLSPLGIRTVTFDANTGFALNGQRMKLRGVNMHHDLGALGAAINTRAMERQVEILMGMGVNAIRTSHNPPAPELLDITDRKGILILDEAFDTWTQTKTANDYGRVFGTWAQQDLQDMVKRDRNHPSVIMWSIGNEVGGATTSTAQKLKDWVLAMDKTRAITWASNKMGGPHVSEGDDRNVAKLLDVVGYNYAPYAGDYDADRRANPGWKIMGTEIAAAVRTRGVYHTPAGTVTKATSQSSPDRQCSSYDNEAAGFGETAEKSYLYDEDRAFVQGSFIWAGFDYLGEPTPYSSWPSKSSYFGAIDTAGFPKDVYYFYQSRWTTEPMVHILPHWNWKSGDTVVVYVYSNCTSVELFLNDASQGAKSLASGKLHFEWSVPWASGTLRAECTAGGSASATMKTAGAAARIALSADRDGIRADGQDMVFITADIVDASGVLVPAGNANLTWSISGSGTLVGLDNGDPIDTTSHKGTSRKAFNGKALAMVRATKTAGTITIKATASGLASEPLAVSAR